MSALRIDRSKSTLGRNRVFRRHGPYRKLPAIQWHRHLHDHKVEIATGRVQVLDIPLDQASKVTEAAAGRTVSSITSGSMGRNSSDGTVSFPRSLRHKFPGYFDK